MAPRSSIDITFDRASQNAKMYRLWSDPGKPYARNLIANLSELPPYGSWSLGKDDWKDDHVKGKENCGRLYHGELSWYPVPGGEVVPLPLHVAVKWMRGERMVNQLRHEAEMYMGPLHRLQGQVVPIFYGFFTGKIEGVHIGCIVLEWCPGNEWMTFGKPDQKELADRWEAVQLLHRAGVKHGQLYKRRDSLRLWEGRHFLRARDGKLRIVDFQQARKHDCAGSMRPHEDLNIHLDHKCRELCFAEIHLRRAIEGGPDFKTPWLPY